MGTFWITGATGRLGCEITARLEQLGQCVVPLVFDGYPLQPKRLKWYAQTLPVEIKNFSNFKRLKKPDYVIHLHWQVNRELSFTEQLLYEIDWNIHRLAFLWEELAQHSLKRIVNLSSIKVFSSLNSNPISATTPPAPISPYGIAKITAEQFLNSQFNQCVTHLRLSSVASVGEHPSHLLSQLYASAFQEKKIRINVPHSTALLYIEEAADLIINAAWQELDNYYLVSGEEITNQKIAQTFEQLTKRKLHADYVDLAPNITDLTFISDAKKLQTTWTRTYTLPEMINKFIVSH
jgi:nucleoside-diphosphate-sugar epimerase